MTRGRSNKKRRRRGQGGRITAKRLYDVEAKLLGRTKTWEEAGDEMRWAYEGVVREGLKEGLDLVAMQKACKESRERVSSGKPYAMREGSEGERRTWGIAGVHMGPIEDDS